MTEPHESSRVRVDVLMGPTDLDDALRADVRHGLTSTPKELPPKWFYDDRGCELFDADHPPPRVLPDRARARDPARRGGHDRRGVRGPTRWSSSARARPTRHGSCSTRSPRAGALERFVPFEISETTLRAAAAAIADEYPGIDVHAVVGDFERHLGDLPSGGTRLIAFLGGTIGNFAPAERKRFLADLADAMRPGDHFLLGTDLVKDVDRLEAAYDDAQGVTAEFNLNVLARGQPRARRRLRRRRASPTWPASTATRSGSRCGCVSLADQTVTIGALRPRRRVRRGRGDAHRDQRQVPSTRHRGRAGRRRPAPRALDDRSRRRLRPQPVGARVALAHRGATPRLHASISAYPSGRCSTSALMRSRVVRMPLRLVLPRAHPSNAQ